MYKDCTTLDKWKIFGIGTAIFAGLDGGFALIKDIAISFADIHSNPWIGILLYLAGLALCGYILGRIFASISDVSSEEKEEDEETIL